MHTTTGPQGTFFHHDGGYTGEVRIHSKDGDELARLPFEDLEYLVACKVRSERIAHLECMSATDLLKTQMVVALPDIEAPEIPDSLKVKQKVICGAKDESSSVGCNFRPVIRFWGTNTRLYLDIVCSTEEAAILLAQAAAKENGWENDDLNSKVSGKI